MEPSPASIAIFQRSVEYPEITRPLVSDEIFETAKRVVNTKVPEIIRSRNGVFVISYSESGPFQDKINEEWLPVHIMRLAQWHSGGIKKSELEEFETKNQDETDEETSTP